MQRAVYTDLKIGDADTIHCLLFCLSHFRGRMLCGHPSEEKNRYFIFQLNTNITDKRVLDDRPPRSTIKKHPKFHSELKGRSH